MLKPVDAVQIRGNRYTLMTLALHSTDVVVVARALHTRIQQAPAFLSDSPVIVDFSEVGVPAKYNFNLLFKVIRQQQLLPVGVRGLPEHMTAALQAAGVPVVELTHSRTEASSDADNAAVPEVTVGVPGETLLISRSLRAGERVYARDADLVVVGDCRPDNELLADGHIHVYGALRGHVVCGFQGNRAARIFCRELDTCSVAVAGIGMQQLPSPAVTSGALQIALCGDELKVQSLTDGV